MKKVLISIIVMSVLVISACSNVDDNVSSQQGEVNTLDFLWDNTTVAQVDKEEIVTSQSEAETKAHKETQQETQKVTQATQKETQKVTQATASNQPYSDTLVISNDAEMNKIDNAGVRKAGYKKIIIKEGVTYIKNYAFSDCKDIISVSIPKSVKSIGEGAFLYCSGLKSIDIPEGVTAIKDMCFVYCENLVDIKLPSSLVSIDESAFMWCMGFTNVNIPNGVKTIGPMAYIECLNLVSVTIPDSVTSISDNAFDYCEKLTTIYGKKGSVAEQYANKKGYIFVEK